MDISLWQYDEMTKVNMSNKNEKKGSLQHGLPGMRAKLSKRSTTC